MASDLKSDLVMGAFQSGPTVHLMANPAVTTKLLNAFLIAMPPDVHEIFWVPKRWSSALQTRNTYISQPDEAYIFQTNVEANVIVANPMSTFILCSASSHIRRLIQESKRKIRVPSSCLTPDLHSVIFSRKLNWNPAYVSIWRHSNVFEFHQLTFCCLLVHSLLPIAEK